MVTLDRIDGILPGRDVFGSSDTVLFNWLTAIIFITLHLTYDHTCVLAFRKAHI